MSIKEMIAARAAALAKGRALVDTATGAKRQLTDAERAEYEGYVAEAERLFAAIAAAAEAGTTGAAGAEDAARAATQAVAAERARIAELETIGRVGRLEDTLVREHITNGTSIDEFRRLAFAAMATRSAQGGEVRTHNVQITRDEIDTRRSLVENAVLNRCTPTIKLIDGANEFRGYTLLELGRRLLELRGIRTGGLGRMELASAALGLREGGGESTSDLASVLANVMNKSLRNQYLATSRTFLPWARMSTNPDFKQISRTQLSGAPSLLEVKEGAEYKRGAFSDGKEVYQLATYGRTVAFTRQALINDDLSALTRVPALMGSAAADLESDTVYAVLTANAAMADTGALFNSTVVTTAGGHANLAGTPAVINVANLGIGRAAMRAQKGLEGRNINVVPAFLLVPSALEQVAYQFTSSQFVPAQSSSVNEFRQGGRTALEPIVEPRLDANSTTAWYLSADPSQIDTVEYCYLEGNEGVYTESRVGFEVDGVELKVRHDFAAKALEWRSMFKNAGA